MHRATLFSPLAPAALRAPLPLPRPTLAERLVAGLARAFLAVARIGALARPAASTRERRNTLAASELLQTVASELRQRPFGELRLYAHQAQPVSFVGTPLGERLAARFAPHFQLSGRFEVMTPPAGGERVALILVLTWSELGTQYARTLTTHYDEPGVDEYFSLGWAR